MWDLFGTKKRKARRIEGYKEQYRNLPESARKEHNDFLLQCVVHGVFRNEAVVEMLTAAAEVLREEAQEIRQCEAGKSK